MFASRVAKSTASSAGKEAAQRSMPVAASFERAGLQLDDATLRASERTQGLKRAAAPGPAWDFGRIPVHPRERATPSRAGGQPAMSPPVSSREESPQRESPERPPRRASNSSKPASVGATLAEAGRPLDGAELEYFEAGLGHDFS